jgi:hypothetical protein
MSEPDHVRTAPFARIGSVDPADRSTWEGKAFLTFDVDWASDEVIADTLDLVEAAEVEATWFTTHHTPLLERIRANPKFELGIHPNFNFLLAGDPRNGATAEEVVDRLMAIVPEARSVRSHSLVQGGRLFELFRAKGLTHDSNAFLPEQSGIALRPWVDWFGIVRVPYFWEDDFWCDSAQGSPIEALESRAGLRGYDFHPIHVYLNTERLQRYEDAREHFRDAGRLRAFRNESAEGTRDILEQLLAARRGG